MNELPRPMGSGRVLAWRLDAAIHAATWDSGIGASLGSGGRWNSAGVRAVYCSFDPATTILESAVHKGFRALDRVAHVLTSLEIVDPAGIFVLQPDAVLNPNWLHPGLPTRDQQAFGDDLMAAHTFVALPSVVSAASWNMIFRADLARNDYRFVRQDRFALDPRLHPARSQ